MSAGLDEGFKKFKVHLLFNFFGNKPIYEELSRNIFRLLPWKAEEIEGFYRWIGNEEGQRGSVGQQSQDDSFFECTRYNPHGLPSKIKNN